MQRLSFIVIVLLLICSCRFGKSAATSFLGTWRLSDISEGVRPVKTSGDNLLDEAAFKEILKEGLLLSLFEDGTFTEVTGNGRYRFGKWSYVTSDRKRIRIGDFYEAAFERSGTGGKQVLVLSRQEDKALMKMVLSARPVNTYQDDPFYYTHNRWRDKTPDSLPLIQAKLTNYFEHLTLLLKAAMERKSEVVSFEFSQGIVRIYNGGIGIIPPDKQSESWYAVFETRAAAKHATDMYNKYMSRATYKGGSKGDWVADDYDILLFIYSDFKKGNIYQ